MRKERYTNETKAAPKEVSFSFPFFLSSSSLFLSFQSLARSCLTSGDVASPKDDTSHRQTHTNLAKDRERETRPNRKEKG